MNETNDNQKTTGAMTKGEAVRSSDWLGDGKPRTMLEREGAAEAALMRDIKKARDQYDIVMVDKTYIPKGAKLVECYETATEWVVVGNPPDGEDANGLPLHNCDEMGCTSMSCVVARMKKPKSPSR